MEISSEWKRRFAAKYSRNAENQCWEWVGAKLPKGYGIIKIPGTRKQEYAHRLSYMIHKGEIPDGMYVLHRCDNPCCVNPEHLKLGTCKDNLQDMKQKDRHTRGERNNQSVLTDADVRKIKALLATGEFSQAAIGEIFGVAQITISKISRGLRWSHVK